MRTLLFAGMAVVVVGAAGCGQRDSAVAAGESTGVVAAPVDPGAAHGDPGAAGALSPTPAQDARIALLESEKAAPVDLAQAYAERGAVRMNDSGAAPRVKYPAALQDFRAAHALDPNNEMAKQGKDLIEQIYASLGRPVPQ